MPQTVNVNGVGKVNFPDDFSPDQITKAIETDILPTAGAKPKANPYQQQAIDEMSTTEKTLVGVGRGMTDIGHGVKQLALRAGNKVGLVNDQTVKDFEGRATEEARLFQPLEDSSTAAMLGRIGGQVAATLPIPGGATLRGAAASGAASAALNFVPEGESRLENAAKGAAGGAAGFAALRAATAAGSKVYNAARGRLSPQAQEIADLAAKHDVPASAGDISRNPLIQKAEVATESIPVVGMAKYRATGNVKAKAAAENVGDDLRDQMIAADYRGLPQVQQRAQAGDKVAKALLEDMQASGDDWTRILKTSGNVKAYRARLVAGKLYDRVENMAANMGAVDKTGTLRAVDDAITKAENSVLPDGGLLKTLTTMRENLAGRDVDFSTARALRSDLGDLVSDYYKGSNAVIGAKGAGLLQGIRNAVDEDMSTFATTHGRGLGDAWRKADSFYRGMVVPFKDRELAKALKDAPPDEIYGKFIQHDKGDRAQRFYEALDAKGRSAVRYGMVANALEHAVDEPRGIISPAKFASSLERVKDARGVFFQGPAKAEIDGFTKLMRHVSRHGQYAENPPTGQRVIPWLLAGGAVVSPESAAGITGAALAARLMFTTDVGKRFLLAANKAEINSPALQRVMSEIGERMPRVAAMAAAGEGRDENRRQGGQ